ncbi:magnesium/cobalt transporter CorA [Phnomibacter sp. MR]|uniref:magnesium/cobalt transporter CorA n=1 Tax=Phnomibacter sp. MR TaxID=3042318 RepID=UPI003A80D4D9
MATAFRKNLPKITYRTFLRNIARQKTRAVVKPHVATVKSTQPKERHISVFDYNPTTINYHQPQDITECFSFKHTPTITWINMDGMDNEQMEKICSHYNIHWLIQEDVMSHGQRPKVDEIEGVVYCLLNMLFINTKTNEIIEEQISIVMGENFILSFQEDAEKDVFDPIRKRLQISTSREREKGADYLFYALIDLITDSYLAVIEQLGNQIEQIEEQIMQRTSKHTFEKISQLRKDIILLKRNIAPTRDVAASLIRTESDLIQERTSKYFKDVYDHVVQANDLIDNYRDLIIGLQDMYVNNINLRMNEVMKTLAIITSIMAPATVIGGVFGMNFDIIPYAHHNYGFYGTIAVMIIIPIVMILWFYRRGWFQNESRPGKIKVED